MVRRRRVRKRQVKMIMDFAEKQHRFMKTVTEGGEEADETGANMSREYDCVHCH